MQFILHLSLFLSYAFAAVAVAIFLPLMDPTAGRASGLLAGLVVLMGGGLAHEFWARRGAERRINRRLLALKKAYDVTRRELADLQTGQPGPDRGAPRNPNRQQQPTPTPPAPRQQHPDADDSPTRNQGPPPAFLMARRDEPSEMAAPDEEEQAMPAMAEAVAEAERQVQAESEAVHDVAAEVRVLHGLIEKLYSDDTPAADRAHETSAEGDRKDGKPDLRVVSAESQSRLLDIVRDGLRQDRVDLYLQPIVSLPQRKRRFFECYSRIRSEAGDVIAPDQYLSVAKQAGLVTAIDNMLLFRCMQLLRKLQRKDYAIEFFCNVSANTMSDREFLSDFVSYMESHVELAPSLVLELTQADLDERLAVIEPDLMKLGKLGYRFSLDSVTDINLDIGGLVDRHFHYVKIDAGLILQRIQDGGAADIRMLKQQLDQHDVDLIVERIESEQMLVELLDFNIDFGQGYLFGEPRISKDPTSHSQTG
ncbi:MAG: EAL domain-containing protein [Alphaproteobacteria bacterium]